jgi:Protein of unknown function (DUF2934)
MFTKTRRHHHPDRASNAERRWGRLDKPAPAGRELTAEEQSRKIQIRAYALWEQAGKPPGDAARERFWREAEKNTP